MGVSKDLKKIILFLVAHWNEIQSILANKAETGPSYANPDQILAAEKCTVSFENNFLKILQSLNQVPDLEPNYDKS